MAIARGERLFWHGIGGQTDNECRIEIGFNAAF